MFECLSDAMGLLRTARQYLRDTATRRLALDATPASGDAAMLCKTASGGDYPSGSPAVFMVVPQELDAEDDEGATASYSGDGDQAFFAVNLGTSAPPEGTSVIVHSCGGRWVFRYD